MSQRKRPEIRELVAAAVNGEATPDQLAELEAELLASESARDLYLDYVNLHGELRRRFLVAADLATEEESPSATDLGLARKGSAAPRWWSYGAAALALLLMAVHIWQSWLGTAAGPLATIQSLEGEVTLVSAKNSHRAAVGDVLRTGDSLRVDADTAHAVMQYADGTTVHLHNGAVVKSPGEPRVRLQLLSGSMEVDAADRPQEQAIVFTTRHSRYVVLGTRFRLYEEEDGSRLELDEGRVRLERPGSGEKLEVDAGNVVICSGKNSPAEVLPLSGGRAQLAHTLPRAGQKVEIHGQNVITSSFQSGLAVWNLADYSLIDAYPADAGYSDGLAMSQDGRVVQVNRQGYLLAWKPGETDALKFGFHKMETRSRAGAPDGRAAVVSGTEGTQVYRVDSESQSIHESLSIPPTGKAWCLALTPRGERLAAGYWDGTVNVYAVPSGEITFTRRLQHTPTHLDIAADGSCLVVATQRDGLIVIDLASGEQRMLWPPGPNLVRCLRFSADGKRVMAGLNDRTARLWNVADGRPLIVIEAGHSPQGIAWSEEKQLLVTADGAVKFWQCTLPGVIDGEAR